MVIVLCVFLGLSLGALLFTSWRLRTEHRLRRAAEKKAYQTVFNEEAPLAEPSAARRVSMREGNGARVVDVRRSGGRSGKGHLIGNENGNENIGSNAPLNGNRHGRIRG